MAATTTTASISLTHFYDALELIDDNGKSHYLEAQRRCHPRVLEEEAHPNLFIARDQGNPWAAARRLCDYWQNRVRLFGERAFYPLLASTRLDHQPSALTKEDIAMLEVGYGLLLPPNRHGHTVIYIDQAKLTTPYLCHATSTKIRCFFYLFTKALMEQPADSSTAYHVEIVSGACKPPEAGYDWQFGPDFLAMPDYMPICIEAIHICVVQPSISGRGWMLNFVIQSALNAVGAYNAQLMKLHYGHAKSKEEEKDSEYMVSPLLRELKREGFRHSGLPDCVGGSFTEQSFATWLNQQRRKEEKLFVSEEDRVRKLRESNKCHSRLKRQRRKKEFDHLQDHVGALKAEYVEKAAINARLEDLLQQAKCLATLIGQQNSDQAANAAVLLCAGEDALPLKPTVVSPHMDDVHQWSGSESVASCAASTLAVGVCAAPLVTAAVQGAEACASKHLHAELVCFSLAEPVDGPADADAGEEDELLRLALMVDPPHTVDDDQCSVLTLAGLSKNRDPLFEPCQSS